MVGLARQVIEMQKPHEPLPQESQAQNMSLSVPFPILSPSTQKTVLKTAKNAAQKKPAACVFAAVYVRFFCSLSQVSLLRN